MAKTERETMSSSLILSFLCCFNRNRLEDFLRLCFVIPKPNKPFIQRRECALSVLGSCYRFSRPFFLFSVLVPNKLYNNSVDSCSIVIMPIRRICSHPVV